MCTVNVDAACVVPAGTVTGPQVSTPAVIAQLPFQPAPARRSTRTDPHSVGSVSVQRHAVRVPNAVVPDGQREPDRTRPRSLRSVRRLQDVNRRRRHTRRGRSLSEPSLVVVTLPVLSITPVSGQTPPSSSRGRRGDVHRERRASLASSRPAPSPGHKSAPAVIGRARSNRHPGPRSTRSDQRSSATCPAGHTVRVPDPSLRRHVNPMATRIHLHASRSSRCGSPGSTVTGSLSAEVGRSVVQGVALSTAQPR